MLQYGLQILVSLLISVLVWTSLSVFFLSSGILSIGIAVALNPISETAKLGAIVGLSHGFLTALLIIWLKSDSIIGPVKASVFSTEILIAAGFAIGFLVKYNNRPASAGKPATSPGLEDYYALVVSIVVWYMVLSLVFLLPSIAIGFIDYLLSPSRSR